MSLYTFLKEAKHTSTSSRSLSFNGHKILNPPRGFKGKDFYIYTDFIKMVRDNTLYKVTDHEWILSATRNYGVKKLLFLAYEEKNMMMFHHLYKILKTKYVIQEVEREEKEESQKVVYGFLSKVQSIPNLKPVIFGNIGEDKDNKDNKKKELEPLVNESNKLLAEIQLNNNKKKRLKEKIHDFLEDYEFVELFHEFCKIGDLRMVKFLLEEGYDPNSKNENGNSSIFIAIDNNKIEVVKLLLSLQKDFYENNKEELLYNVQEFYGKYKTQLLNNIEVNLKSLDSSGFTPYMRLLIDYYYLHDNSEVITLLENKGELLTKNQHYQILSNAYFTVYHPNGRWLFRHLVTKKFILTNTDQQILNYESLLMKTLSTNDLDNTEFLLENGHNINEVNEDQSLLGYAVRKDNLMMINLLLSFNIDVNLCSPLKLAIANRNIPVIKLLMENGAELELQFLLPLIRNYNSSWSQHKHNIRIYETLFFLVTGFIERKKFFEENLDPFLPPVLSSIINEYSSPFDEYIEHNDTILTLMIKTFNDDQNQFKNKTESEIYTKRKFEFLSLIAHQTNLKSEHGVYALTIACEMGNKDIIRLLIKNKATITLKQLTEIRFFSEKGKKCSETDMQKLSNTLIKYVLTYMNEE
jgi:ankyrin repeat protein